MIRRPPRSTPKPSSAASDVYKRQIWSDSENGFRSVPSDSDYTVSEDSIYFHYTSNNTLMGTQYHHLPDSGGKPRVVDASSDIAGVPIDVSAHDIIYAGAQKNLGPSGVTLVILSPWALARAQENSDAGRLPTMLDYTVHASKGSLFNTPNTFGIFVLDCVFKWLEYAECYPFLMITRFYSCKAVHHCNST